MIKYSYRETNLVDEKKEITFALSKGRIFDETLPILRLVGMEPIENFTESRKLIIATKKHNTKIVLIRATDVPTYVKYGAADFGIAGKDVLLEQGADGLYQPLD